MRIPKQQMTSKNPTRMRKPETSHDNSTLSQHKKIKQQCRNAMSCGNAEQAATKPADSFCTWCYLKLPKGYSENDVARKTERLKKEITCPPHSVALTAKAWFTIEGSEYVYAYCAR